MIQEAALLAMLLDEASVRSLHAALDAKKVTCAQVVRHYLTRIETYDDRGPGLNAVIAVNPRAVAAAEEMDRIDRATRARRPLHCVPVILKDNYHTADMPTTGGSKTFASLQTPSDGFVVRKLREAGAIIIAKANLHELARSGTTVSSLGGQTRNPYDLTRTPGGSSGGTGAAIAANFAVLGTGSDTGQSTRSPSSANSLVGVRGTRGLVSRAGVMPFSTTQDEIGPIARTVEDAARMLDVMAGYDPDDPITAFGHGRRPASYAAALDAGALSGARIGMLTDFIGTAPIHADVNRVVDQAVATMTAKGATVIRVSIPNLDDLTRGLSLMTFEFKTAFDSYLASLGPISPVKSLAEFVARGEFHESMRRGLEADLRSEGPGTPEYLRMVERRNVLRQAVMTVIAANRLDAILYPHQKRLVVPIGEEQAERNGVLSNSTGFPALTFPGGFSPPTANAAIGVPVGLELLGPEWSEATLFRLAYAFEQATRARKPPPTTPPLK
jgi:Asp-tRNA(Asn)/Glu-tRNA(Gln) amidotransferase A subunit family amidase